MAKRRNFKRLRLLAFMVDDSSRQRPNVKAAKQPQFEYPQE
jgi:hypothetical protein